MESDVRGEEIAALLNEIKQRVRAKYPSGSAPFDIGTPEPVQIPLADLMPLVHARDAAQAKMAAIGTVNPRPSGPLNTTLQALKRSIARGLGWFVRDQIVFNREMIACVEAVMEALNEVNLGIRSIAGQFGSRLAELSLETSSVLRSAGDLSATAERVIESEKAFENWRYDWDRKSAETQAEWTRAFSALREQMLGGYREASALQAGDFRRALDTGLSDLQKRFWDLQAQQRVEIDRMIHGELRTLRQRLRAAAPESPHRELAGPVRDPGQDAREAILPSFDEQRFADRFRGTEDRIRASYDFYEPYFRGRTRVLDVGCGRGEFLETLREIGVPATGIDLGEENILYCQAKGLEAEKADLFAFLANESEGAFDGIFCGQVVEHIDPARVPEMVRLFTTRLRSGGVLAMETPNPACLAIFATHFYLDPTHRRPVPAELLAFYLEEFGMGGIEVYPRFPALESFPEISELPPGFAGRFFGGQDYAILARKL